MTGGDAGGALAGRRVLVAGASAGIGRAFAVHAVGAGAEVVLVARRAEALQEVVAEAGGGHAVAATSATKPVWLTWSPRWPPRDRR